MKTRLLPILVAVLGLCLLPACTSIQYRTKDGTEIKASSFLNRRSISKATYDPATGKFMLQGYNSEQTELAAAVAGAIANKTP